MSKIKHSTPLSTSYGEVAFGFGSIGLVQVGLLLGGVLLKFAIGSTVLAAFSLSWPFMVALGVCAGGVAVFGTLSKVYDKEQDELYIEARDALFKLYKHQEDPDDAKIQKLIENPDDAKIQKLIENPRFFAANANVLDELLRTENLESKQYILKVLKELRPAVDHAIFKKSFTRHDESFAAYIIRKCLYKGALSDEQREFLLTHPNLENITAKVSLDHTSIIIDRIRKGEEEDLQSKYFSGEKQLAIILHEQLFLKLMTDENSKKLASAIMACCHNGKITEEQKNLFNDQQNKENLDSVYNSVKEFYNSFEALYDNVPELSKNAEQIKSYFLGDESPHVDS